MGEAPSWLTTTANNYRDSEKTAVICTSLEGGGDDGDVGQVGAARKLRMVRNEDFALE